MIRNIQLINPSYRISSLIEIPLPISYERHFLHSKLKIVILVLAPLEDQSAELQRHLGWKGRVKMEKLQNNK